MRVPLTILVALASMTARAAADDEVSYDEVTVTHDCDKDKKSVDLNNKVTITLVGKCTNLIVAGAHNKVIGPTRRLAVSGNSNVIDVENAETIIVVGNDNTVTWKGGFEGAKKPKVSDSGKRNKIVAAPVPKPPAKPPSTK